MEREVESVRSAVLLELLADSVRQALEPADAHPRFDVLPFDVAGRDQAKIRAALNRVTLGSEADGRAMALLALRLGAVDLYELRKAHLASESAGVAPVSWTTPGNGL